MSENTSTIPTGGSGQSAADSGDGMSHEGEGQEGGYSITQFFNDSKDIKTVDQGDVKYTDDEQTQSDGVVPGSEEKPAEEGESEEEGSEESSEEETPPRQRTLQEIQRHRQEQKAGRKYDGLDEKESKLFKQMSQQAYETLYPAYLAYKKGDKELNELKTLNKTLEERRWYEEENAWELAPEYRASKENLDMLDFEENYWTEQLAKIERGEDFNPLAGEPGKYKEGPATPATVEAKVDILRKLQTIGGYKQQLTSKIDGIRTSFSGKHKSFQEGLKGVDSYLFGKLDVKLPHLAPKYQEWLNKFPAEFRGQLPYQMLAKAAIVIEGLAKQLRERDATAGLKKTSANAAKSVGPGNGKATGDSTEAGSRNSPKYWDKTFENLIGKRLS